MQNMFQILFFVAWTIQPAENKMKSYKIVYTRKREGIKSSVTVRIPDSIIQKAVKQEGTIEGVNQILGYILEHQPQKWDIHGFKSLVFDIDKFRPWAVDWFKDD